jgi:hypothetical protein
MNRASSNNNNYEQQPQNSIPTHYSASATSHTTTAAAGPPPPLSDFKRWFDHFDRDGNGTLDREELLNALVQTFQSNDPESVREILNSILPVFDCNGDGLIDRSEFSSTEGLGESLLSALQNIQITKYAEWEKMEHTRLEQEQQQQQQLSAQDECVICQDEKTDHAIIPCGHHCLCNGCADRIMTSVSRKCPLCRVEIVGTLKIYQ